MESVSYLESVVVNEDEERGRHSVARHHLDVGTVVARETALASVPYPDKVVTALVLYALYVCKIVHISN